MNALGTPALPSAHHEDQRFDAAFREHYARIARVIGRVVHDQGRAEELAVDVFLRWRAHPRAHGDGAEGWLYRTAVRAALDAWRRDMRWARVRRLLAHVGGSPRTPEDLHAADVERRQVRVTLARLRPRDATVLLLWIEDASYADIAAAVQVRASSVGSLVARAQAAFRKDYETRYGTHS